MLPFLESMETRDYLFAAGVTILVFTVFRMARVRLARKAAEARAPGWRDHQEEVREVLRSDATSSRPGVAINPGGNGGNNVGAEVEQVLVQIQTLARDVEARLDTKARYVSKLIQESEELLGRIETAHEKVRQTLDHTESLPESGRELFGGRGAEPESAVTRGSGTSGPATSDPAEEEIARLSGEGLAPAAIADKVGRRVGEVELILSLRQQAKSQNGS